MVWDDSLFEVTRREYSEYIHRMKPEIKDIRESGDPDGTMHTEIWSKTHNIRLCGRVFNPLTESTEHYYIWDYPEENEMQQWEPPSNKYILETPEQVQAVLNEIKRLHNK